MASNKSKTPGPIQVVVVLMLSVLAFYFGNRFGQVFDFNTMEITDGALATVNSIVAAPAAISTASVRIVLPLVGLAIESAIVDGNTERENLRPLRSHAKLRIARKMTGNVDAVDRHARGPFSSWLLTDTKIPQHFSITRENDEFFKEK